MESLQLYLNIIVTIFVTLALPFAGTVIYKLGKIETTLENSEWLTSAMNTVKDEVSDLRVQIAKLEKQ